MPKPSTPPPPTAPAFGPLADWALLAVVGLLLGIPSAMLLWRMAFGSAQHPSLAATAAAIEETGGKVKAKSLLRTYVPENFGFKGPLVDVAAIAQVEWLGVSSTPRVLLGQEGWLYIKDPPETVDELRGTAPLPDHLVERIVATWRYYAHEFATRDIPFVIAITPDKPTAVPEHLPAWLKPRLAERRTAQVLERIAAEAPDLPVLDLRPAVLALEAAGVQTFQKTDTHWTDAGAFAGYTAIMQWIAERVPQARVLERDDLDLELEDRGYGGDLSNFLGLAERMSEVQERLVVRDAQGMPEIQEGKQRFRIEGGTGAADMPTLVMYRDSFAHRLQPYLDESFGRTVYLWPSSAGQAQGAIDIASVMEAEPDVVVFELTERWFTINPSDIGVLDPTAVATALGEATE